MVKVGARIRLSSGKGPDRDGVVTAVTGSILRVRWPSGENTMVVPAPGTLTVLASSGDKASAAARKRVATKRPAKKAPAKKAATRKAATRKAAPERGATKHTASAKKAATKKATTGGAKRTEGVKRPSR
jgi:hypothetical protein